MSTSNLTWTNLGMNPYLYGGELVPDRLGHGTSQLQLQYSRFINIMHINSCNENKGNYWSIPMHFQVAQYQTSNFRNIKEIWNINTSETRAVFVFAGMEARETKTTMEYCCGVARQQGGHCCGRSGSSALGFGFPLDSLAYTYIGLPNHTCSQYRPALKSTWPDLPERKILCKSRSDCT